MKEWSWTFTLCSVTQLCLTLCDPVDCSTPGFPIHHQLMELAQTHVQWVGDTIQLSHPLPSPSPPIFNLSQHQCLFQWVSSSHQVAKVLELQLQHQSFQWILRTVFLQEWLVWSPCSPRESQESSPTPQFKSINSLVLILYGPTLTSIHDYWENHSFDYKHLCRQSNVSSFSYDIQVCHSFLPSSKHLLISWLQSPSAVILEPKKIKSVTVSIVSLSICHKVMGPDAIIIVFWMLNFKPAFLLSSFTIIKRLFSSSSLSAIRAVSSACLRLLIFLPAIFTLYYIQK